MISGGQKCILFVRNHGLLAMGGLAPRAGWGPVFTKFGKYPLPHVLAGGQKTISVGQKMISGGQKLISGGQK